MHADRCVWCVEKKHMGTTDKDTHGDTNPYVQVQICSSTFLLGLG